MAIKDTLGQHWKEGVSGRKVFYILGSDIYHTDILYMRLLRRRGPKCGGKSAASDNHRNSTPSFSTSLVLTFSCSSFVSLLVSVRSRLL